MAQKVVIEVIEGRCRKGSSKTKRKNLFGKNISSNDTSALKLELPMKMEFYLYKNLNDFYFLWYSI